MPVSDDEDDEEDAFAETVVEPGEPNSGTALQVTATSSSKTEVTATAQRLSVSAMLQPESGQMGQPHVVISTQLMLQPPVQSRRLPDDFFDKGCGGDQRNYNAIKCKYLDFHSRG